VLKNKISGYEDPRTNEPSEPRDLGYDGRQNKKKGKEALKLEMPAVPEAYMAFGQEGASQRLLPGVVTLEKPGAKGGKDGKGGGQWSDDETPENERPELLKGKDLSDLAPDVVQIKFDVAFVDDEARQAFALQQAAKLAHLLQLPEHYVSVRGAIPGSPMTVVTFDIVGGAAMRSVGGRADGDSMRTNRPFDSPVLEVGVVSSVDEHAASLLELMTAVVGNKVPVHRIKGGKSIPGGPGATGAKNVKFGQDDSGPKPAYQRSREELEAAAKRHGGPLMSDKEAIDNDSTIKEKRMMKEHALKDDKPIVAYDRRLPKNAVELLCAPVRRFCCIGIGKRVASACHNIVTDSSHECADS
jgi:hypothetical protein